MAHLRIQTKLLVSFLVIAFLGAIPLFIGLSGTHQLQNNIRSMEEKLERVQSIMLINDFLKSVMARQLSLLTPDLPLANRQQIYKDIDAGLLGLGGEIRHYESMAVSSAERERLLELNAQLASWRDYSRHFIVLSKELDSTDIHNPLQFQNTLLEYRESASDWVADLSNAIANEAPFKGAVTSEDSMFGPWLFGLSSKNANLAVAIGKARKPLGQLFFSARKINTLIFSEREEVFEPLMAVFESETLPAKRELFQALESMRDEAQRATLIYGEMGALANTMSQSFAVINTSLEGLIQSNRDEAKVIVATSNRQVTRSNSLSWSMLPAGLVVILLLSMFLARKIMRPIVDFNMVIKRFIAENDFTLQAKVLSRDEVGQVAQSFNEMVQQLKFYYDELQAKNKDLHRTHVQLAEANLELERHSRTLEQKVVERTGELSNQKEKMLELNTKLVHMNDRLAREVDEHRGTHTELMKARDVAEAADKTKSSFLANMSHEIRTPLNAVLGLTSLALKQEVSPKVHDYLRTVKMSAKSLLGIIEDILDFSKIEAGKLEIETINFSLHDVVADLYEILRQKAEDKGLDFRYHIPDEVADLLVGDPLRLGQVLMNLVGNSLKFTDEGEVFLSVACEKRTDTDMILRFSVADTGCGIPPENMNRLFDPFSQADESISRTHGGTGLGLSISQKIVQQFGGEIWVESEVGYGSVFHFTVKLGLQAEPGPVSQALVTHYAGCRVLIIDDNKMFRHFMAKMFASLCFEVETASCGREGLERLHDMSSLKALPHIVFLDQSMPGMDGFEFLEILRADAVFADIPVVMISASGQSQTLRHRAERMGVRAVLTKPVKRKLLFSTIGSILGKGGDFFEGQAPGAVVERTELLGGYTILLVEDNLINRQVAYEVLVSGGARVDIAVDGVEAVEMMDEKYDGVLMDIQMPRMDGIEAATLIRQNPKFADVAIVAMTARAMKGDREICMNAGMTDYIAKPIEPELLYQVLVKAIGQRDPLPVHHAVSPPGMSFTGINHEKVMRRLNNNEVLFHSLLREFITDHKDVVDELRKLFELGEEEKAVYLVHTLKGVAGNLGADEVQACALAVEQDLRQSQLSETNLRCLETRLQEVFSGVSDLLSPAPELSVETVALPDHDLLAALLVELSRHIQANTPKAEKYAQSLPLYDDASYLKYRSQILGYLDKFDFESARIALIRMASALGVSV